MSEIKRLKIEAKEILFQNGQKQIFEFFKLGLLNIIPTIFYFIILIWNWKLYVKIHYFL